VHIANLHGLSLYHDLVLLLVGDLSRPNTERGLELPNWNLFKNTLFDNLSLYPIPSCSSKIDTVVSSFENTINYSVNASPTQKIVNNFNYIYPSHLKELINKRGRLKRIFMKGRTPCDKFAFDKISKAVKRELNAFYNNLWDMKL
jgi:DNA polymerase elongation subunit (family B)